MLYSVKYRKTDSFFWRKIKNIKGDGFFENTKQRFFTLDDESMIEIPINDMIFKFDRNRFLDIKQNMENQAGQTLPLKKN